MDNVFSKIPEPPKLGLADLLLNVLSTKANDILNTDYINEKDLNEKKIEDIKEGYDFEDINNTLDGNISQQLKVFWSWRWKFYNCLVFPWT